MLDNKKYNEVLQFLESSRIDVVGFGRNGQYIDVDGKLTADQTSLLLEEKGVVVSTVLGKPDWDYTRVWFNELELYEEEVTKTVHKVRMGN